MSFPPFSHRLGSSVLVIVLTVILMWLFYSSLGAISQVQPTTPKVEPTVHPMPIAVDFPLIHNDYGYAGLKDLARTIGIPRVGVVVNQSNDYTLQLNAVANTLLPDFNSLSIGTEMKMGAIHPCPPRELYNKYTQIQIWVAQQEIDGGICKDRPALNAPDARWESWEWDWKDMDSIATYAKNNDLDIFGHSLVFHQSIPGWLNAIHITNTEMTTPTYPPLITDAAVAADIRLVMQEHIETVMEYYCQPQFLDANGQPVVYAYDVVNEATRGYESDEEPNPTVDDYLYELTPFIRLNYTQTNSVPLNGNHYVREAFTHARAVLNDPDAQITPNAPCLNKDIQLVYNDKGTQENELWADGIYILAESLTTDLETGQPLAEPLIDAVGFQMHIDMHPKAFNQADYLPPNFYNIQAEMERVADLGLEVMVTELDVALRNFPSAPHYCGYDPNVPDEERTEECSLFNPNPDAYFPYPAQAPIVIENPQSQAWVYQYVVEACRNIPECTMLSFWGLHDENSWLPWFQPHIFNQMPPVVVTLTKTPTHSAEAEPPPMATNTPSPTATQSGQPEPTATATPLPQPRMTAKPAYYAVRTALAASTYTPTPTPTSTVTGVPPLNPTATGTYGGYPPPMTNTPVSYP